MQQQLVRSKALLAGVVLAHRNHATAGRAIGNSKCPITCKLIDFLRPDHPQLRLRAASGEAPTHARHYATQQQLPVARHRAVAAGLGGLGRDVEGECSLIRIVRNVMA
jgi:hypothetical protein